MQEHGNQVLLLQQLQRESAKAFLQGVPEVLDGGRGAAERAGGSRAAEGEAAVWRGGWPIGGRRGAVWCGGVAFCHGSERFSAAFAGQTPPEQLTRPTSLTPLSLFRFNLVHENMKRKKKIHKILWASI